jgi:CRISPR-associated protein Cas2
VDPAQFAELKRALTDIIDLEKDSLRFYFLGAKWHRRIEHIGAKPTYDPEGLLLI